MFQHKEKFKSEMTAEELEAAQKKEDAKFSQNLAKASSRPEPTGRQQSQLSGESGSGVSGTIRGLANFYNGFTRHLFWLFAIGCVAGVYTLVVEINDYSPELPYMIAAASMIGVSLIGIIAVGATAVLLDIMHNIRAINRKTM